MKCESDDCTHTPVWVLLKCEWFSLCCRKIEQTEMNKRSTFQQHTHITETGGVWNLPGCVCLFENREIDCERSAYVPLRVWEFCWFLADIMLKGLYMRLRMNPQPLSHMLTWKPRLRGFARFQTWRCELLWWVWTSDSSKHIHWICRASKDKTRTWYRCGVGGVVMGLVGAGGPVARVHPQTGPLETLDVT